MVLFPPPAPAGGAPVEFTITTGIVPAGGGGSSGYNVNRGVFEASEVM